MNYSHIISDMTWSYSRITCFEQCRYKFLLKYIYEQQEDKMFFASYGSFIHKIMEMYLSGELKRDELLGYYLVNFKSNVGGKPPSQKVFKSYFEQGVEYLKNMNFPYSTDLDVESEVEFLIGENKFIGYIDCRCTDGDNLIILDHKSRNLKPRSTKGKILKTDLELDDYLRQLYIYSIPTFEKYGRYPSTLAFNCFRENLVIKEPFKEENLEKTKKWATDKIEMITHNEDWSPCLDYFGCRHLCGLHDQCEYFQLNK